MSLLRALRVYTNENGLPLARLPEIETEDNVIVPIPGVKTVRVEYNAHDATAVTITFAVRRFEQVVTERKP